MIHKTESAISCPGCRESTGLPGIRNLLQEDMEAVQREVLRDSEPFCGTEEKMRPRNITVYLGAYEGRNRVYRDAVTELGHWIGSNGCSLVYGGSRSGLMGCLADSVLQSGGKVIGVEPRFFVEKEFQHNGLTRLIVTDDMSERKKKMIELGDAFIAFPGGTGTLEEISEVMSMTALKQLTAPCILYNLNGYYDSLRELLQHMIEEGFSTDGRQAGIRFARNLADIESILAET